MVKKSGFKVPVIDVIGAGDAFAVGFYLKYNGDGA